MDKNDFSLIEDILKGTANLGLGPELERYFLNNNEDVLYPLYKRASLLPTNKNVFGRIVTSVLNRQSVDRSTACLVDDLERLSGRIVLSNNKQLDTLASSLFHLSLILTIQSRDQTIPLLICTVLLRSVCIIVQSIRKNHSIDLAEVYETYQIESALLLIKQIVVPKSSEQIGHRSLLGPNKNPELSDFDSWTASLVKSLCHNATSLPRITALWACLAELLVHCESMVQIHIRSALLCLYQGKILETRKNSLIGVTEPSVLESTFYEGPVKLPEFVRSSINAMNSSALYRAIAECRITGQSSYSGNKIY